MATGVVLDPLAQERLKPLQTALQKDFGLEANQKDVVSALVYSASAAVAVGMLIEFTKAKAVRDEAEADDMAAPPKA